LPHDATLLPALGDEFWLAVDDGLGQLGIELSVPARAAIDSHVRLLLAWNAAFNLTALRTERQIAVGHVLDAVAALPVLRDLQATMRPPADTRPSLMDLGSGGGYPGIPLAVALPSGRTALVDSIGKKARFLAVAAAAVMDAFRRADAVPPQLEALAERAEDLADEPDQREAWDLLVARAVGSVAEIAEIGLPLVRRGGYVVAWKRDHGDGRLESEVQEAGRTALRVGGTPPRIVHLPNVGRAGLAGHCLITVRKSRTTPARFPRPASERRRALLP